MSQGQTISDFIRGTFLGTYKTICETEGQAYIGFSLIFTSIELLGKTLDETVEFDNYKKGKPKIHFNKAIKELFDSKYHNLELYEFHRNGFAHCVKPKSNAKLGLTDRKSNNIGTNIKNLTKITGEDKRVLFIEDFYEDFSKACQKLLKKIEDGELRHSKISNIFLPVANIEVDENDHL